MTQASLFPAIPISPFGSLEVRPVEPGTVVRTDDGHELTVTDDCAVLKGRRVYVTHAIYEALKREIPGA